MSFYSKLNSNQFQAGAAIVLSAAAALYYLYRSYSKKNHESTLPDVTHHHPLHPQAQGEQAPVVDATTWSEGDRKLLDDDFELAVAFMRSSFAQAFKIDTKTKLRLYGLYKMATIGNCQTSKPGLFDLEGNAKWSAWRELNGLEKYEAKLSYLQVVTAVCPEWHRIASEEGLTSQDSTGGEEDVSDAALQYDAQADAKRHERARIAREQEKNAEKERLRRRLLAEQRLEDNQDTATPAPTETDESAPKVTPAPAQSGNNDSSKHMGPVFSRISADVSEDDLAALRTRPQDSQSSVAAVNSDSPVEESTISAGAEEAKTAQNDVAVSSSESTITATPVRVCVDDDLIDFCALDDITLVEALLRRRNAKDKIIEDEFGNTLLHHAADAGAVSVCEYLVKDAGYDVNLRDASAQTPLMSAVVSGQVECVKVLLQLGADLNATEENGQNAVDLAKTYNPELRDEMLQVLST